MPTIRFEEPSGRYLSFAEREEIALLCAQDLSIREVAPRLGRAPSTISREVRRNAATRGGKLEYRATVAQWHRDRRASRPKPAKLADNEPLRRYVQDRLGGHIARADGTLVSGPDVAFNERRRGPRQDRRWGRSWSPEQIANRTPRPAAEPRRQPAPVEHFRSVHPATSIAGDPLVEPPGQDPSGGRPAAAHPAALATASRWVVPLPRRANAAEIGVTSQARPLPLDWRTGLR